MPDLLLPRMPVVEGDGIVGVERGREVVDGAVLLNRRACDGENRVPSLHARLLGGAAGNDGLDLEGELLHVHGRIAAGENHKC